MRFCLVIPPSLFLLDERVFASLGILRVAGTLERNGYHVEVLDLSGVKNYEEAAETYARTSTVDVFGVTSTTPQMPAAHRISKAIRRGRPGAWCVLGGPHPTLVHAAARREAENGFASRATRALHEMLGLWEQIVAGDGERAILAIAEGNRQPIIDADDPKTSLFLKRGEVDEFPMPARHLIALETYKYKIDGVPATSLIAQLGCPFACAFCGGRYSPMLRRSRTRATQPVLDEVEFLYKTYGFRGFMFYDDELNVNKEMIELMDGLARMQDRLGVEFRLRGFVKAELLTKQQAEAMYRAGFRWLLTGFESGSPRILTNIDKKATRDDNTRCVELARAAGLKVKALMSIGHAGESHETCRETEEWLYAVEPEDFDVTIITTYPGSPYYDDAVEINPGVFCFTSPKTGDALYGLEVDYNTTADYYKGDPDGGYQAYVYTDHMSREDLVQVRGEMEKRVRAKLGIPWNPSAPALAYEHSMGQLPPTMLKVASAQRPAAPAPVKLPVIG